MLPSKVTDSGVLIIRLRADLDIGSRATAAWDIDDLLAAHRAAPVVLELSGEALSPAAVSTVVRAHRTCLGAGVPLAVVAPGGAEGRRALEAGVGVPAPDVHATAAQAVAAVEALSAPIGAAA
ncbi:STAS domain-containing protein [Streptomyces sp. NPDC057939]|uniref:STAS domain-containing protein n=1 Tax=Streptomyces sp. NPDC057939 TaxID=3346284 RepID=UPI0036E9D160